MRSAGWRTLVIDSFDQLRYHCGQLIVAGDDEIGIPVSQLRCVMAASSQGNISIPLLNELMENHVEVILCDRKYDPSCDIVPISSHASAAGIVILQSKWTDERRDSVWQKIVEQKIHNQISLLRKLSKDISPELEQCAAAVLPGDRTNREGQAARLYFSSLFGNEFIRHTDDDINAALNYGYTILRSAFTRLIVSHGYHTALGIHHCSQYNRFNLACDIMEPFRPFVDAVVWQNRDRLLDKEYRKEFIELLYRDCRFDGCQTDIHSAMNAYMLDVLGAMRDEHRVIREVTF